MLSVAGFEISLKRAILVTAYLVAVAFVGVNTSTFYFIINRQSKELSRNSESTVTHLVNESKTLLENAAIQLLTEKAKDISAQISEIKRVAGSKGLVWSGEHLRDIAVQKVGNTGYSCVYECDTARMLAHPNPKLVGTDMRTLKASLASWWTVFEPSLKCALSKGYYDWKDADGVLRKKYMVMYPVEGTNLMVAATAYVDEFSRNMALIEDEGRQKLKASYNLFSAVTNRSFIAIGLSSLLFLVLTLLIGRAASNSLLRSLDRIRVFAHELSLNNFEMKFGRPPQITELKNIFSSLDRMRDQILSIQKIRADEASSAAAGKLSRQIAHDLRAPLSALTIAVRHFKETKPQADIRSNSELTAMLESVSQRLQEMIDTVLKPRSNFLRNIERFDCKEMLQELASEFTHKYKDSERKIRFRVSSSSESIHLIGSRINLIRVFGNIIQNSTESMADGGVVKVHISQVGTKCEIRVSDNGSGIPQEHFTDIFKEGFTWGKRGGNGLGLSFSQQVVSEHGGDIHVASEPGRGTTMMVSFPLPTQAAADPRHSLSIPDGKRLLVIDDSVLMLTKWFKAAISQGVEGDYFNTFEEAKEAIDWSKFGQTYGLAIVDYLIPQSQYDGIAICKALRSTSVELPIVICTSDFLNERLKTFSRDSSIEILPKTYFDEPRFSFEQHSKREASASQ